MSHEADFEYALIDGPLVQVHQKATGANGGRRLRRSGARGGVTTKSDARVDAPGHLVRFVLLPGQARDMNGAAPLIKGASFNDRLLTRHLMPIGCYKTSPHAVRLL